MKAQYLMQSFVATAVFLVACTQGAGSPASSSGGTSAWPTYDAATPADLPTCAGAILGQLYFVESTNQFEACKSTGWTVIPINGTNGTNNKFATGVSCSTSISGLTGNAGTHLNGLLVFYTVDVTTAGDVFASASVASNSLSIGGTMAYAASQSGASTGQVVFVDSFPSTDSGFWTVSANRTTNVMTAVYTDSAYGSQSPVTINFPSSVCTALTF